VIRNFTKWHSDPYFVKIYTYASGPEESQRLFLSASSEGDLSDLVTSCFNARIAPKTTEGRFGNFVSCLFEHDPKNLFYLTDSPYKAEEAVKAGLTVFVMMREGNVRYKAAQLNKFTVIHSLDQLDLVPFH